MLYPEFKQLVTLKSLVFHGPNSHGKLCFSPFTNRCHLPLDLL